ncbi:MULTISPECIES: chitinase [Paenarthrobacter]|uniref:Glycosyl hydrolase family 18 protein n=2 Tax=Paenarthrobacter TaxID=1742992 RepID=A0AAX3EFS3_PAEUR|nr:MULTISPECIES: glycosyl hydrolase family 18 protein [Paenarthrobacter]NKR10672.1 glycosyl hydrolase family 18 [Arthrobacter sp. M5]NKR16608.1 glycosyl hydrolase family 18 [Arthrobacter sp. M6]OEH60412.1 glycosyl hydrolase family 18 [Arthrobacter sp. D4]OEH61027.1 glycosyl hydrolase family 18 [Arthrobacter sp. D2]MBN9130330.1 glycosyl hydrolase family 18 [Paenarthrobacter ureafaciens]
MSKYFPGRKLSILRLSVLSLVIGGLVAAGITTWHNYSDARAAAASPSTFAGYVDVTATPRYAFEQASTASTKSVVLSFIVADPKDGCTPSWGTFYSLDAAGEDLDLDRRIARLRQAGGSVAVSFGGLSNKELATACRDAARLKAAYAQVVDRYELTSIDLDIEGAALSDVDALTRQAKVISELQKERRENAQDLSVWLTLPVAPTGLTAEGTSAVKQMLSAGVDLAGVNVMTMDYGASRVAGQTMLQASIAAAEATHSQLGEIYSSVNQDLGAQTLWRKIGLTPMIGQNDIVADVFTVADAEGLHDFAESKGVGRMSMWSLNRDVECGPNYPTLTVVSDACSGVAQSGGLFSSILGAERDSVSTATSPAPEPTTTTTAAPVVDDPATSPYPIWSPTNAYVKSDRTVWHGNVYEAKWWTKNDVPNNPVAAGTAAPWQLIGPVLPGDRPQPEVTAPAGTYPVWSAETVYKKGDRVMFGPYVFEAKWWVQTQSPEAALQGSSETAWAKLSNAELAKLLQGTPTPK